MKQVLGAWRSKNPTLQDMCRKIKGLLKKFEAWRICHFDRSLNTKAHGVAQGMIGELYVVKAILPLYQGHEGLSLEE